MLLRDRPHSLGVHFNESSVGINPDSCGGEKIASPPDHPIRRHEWRGRCARQESSTKAGPGRFSHEALLASERAATGSDCPQSRQFGLPPVSRPVTEQ